METLINISNHFLNYTYDTIIQLPSALHFSSLARSLMFTEIYCVEFMAIKGHCQRLYFFSVLAKTKALRFYSNF